MKKIFLALAMTMAIGSVATVFAADTTKELTNDTGETKVEYTMPQSYTIVIPVDFKLEAKGTTVTREVSARNVFIAYNKKLQVKVNSTNASESKWYLKETDDNKLEYSIESGDTTIVKNDVVLEIAAGDTNGGKSVLEFGLVSDVTKAGTYQDTLTFTAELANK